MKDVLVSIIVPAYNVELYIEKCLESCINQTYGNVEIVVVNDGSKDNTGAIAKKVLQHNKRHIYVEQKNKGVSAARNLALEICNGDYCIFLDSDDWLELNTIDILISNLRESKANLVVSECFFVEKNNSGWIIERQGENEKNEIISASKLKELVGVRSKYKLLSSCYKLFDMSIIRSNGIRFDRRIHFGEDGLFTYQYLCHCDLVSYINSPLWNILDRPGSTTKSEFSAKQITGIKAVDLMINYKPINKDVLSCLRKLRGDRAMWVQINSLRSQHSNKFMRYAYYSRKILRMEKKYVLNGNKSVKKYFQVWFLCYSPMPLCAFVLSRNLK